MSHLTWRAGMFVVPCLLATVQASAVPVSIGPQPIVPSGAPERDGTPPASPFVTDNQFHAPIESEALHADRSKIAIGVHGWTSFPEWWWRSGPNSWTQPGVRESIQTALGDQADEWDLWGLDWREGANHGTVSPSTEAEINAQLQGQYIARVVADGNYSHVHLLGHSLGGRVVETAAGLIRQIKPDATIHVTFLDAYTPYTWARTYGSTATWAEHYYTSLDNISGSLTATAMPHALNVDMGAHVQEIPDDYVPGDNFRLEYWRHNSPHQFYKRTAADPTGESWGGYGFGLSKESGRDPWPATDDKFARRQNVTLAADGSFTRAAINGVIEQPANAITRGMVESAVKGSTNASLNEAQNTVTLSAFSAAGNQMGYVNLSLTTTQPVNFFEFNYEWLGLGGGNGRVTFTLHRDGVIFPPQTAFNHLLWASDSSVGFGQSLSTGRIMWTGLNNALQPTDEPLAAGTYEMRFRLDYFEGENISIRIGGIRGGLLSVPGPGGFLLLVTAGLAAHRRRAA
ncbi:MAG: hypothetical protein JNK58_09240 [Phycisphaerae bacterium]|nr:hypothetical protein [Phycisphaerae bacterium]